LDHLVLDVGSGVKNKWQTFIQGKNVIHVDLNKKAYHLEAVCSVYHLPFRDNSINVVHASHLFEHLENPLGALKELKRTSKGSVIIRVPNASFWKIRLSGIGHIFSWNEWTLRNFLNQVFESVEIKRTTRWSIFGNPKFSKLEKMKRVLERGFFGQSELTAVCRAKTDL
jgi:ubiquinone/menaquinone biosynthesis C-methylase UbiE